MSVRLCDVSCWHSGGRKNEDVAESLEVFARILLLKMSQIG